MGLAGTDGVYIDGDLVVDDDMAGRLGANLVLRSPEIDAAVLETARRGIISGGLGFDWCDVGAVLNIGDDHIGTDGVRDIAHLASITGLVAQAARRAAVLNGDDQHCVAMAERAGAARVCYVTIAPDHGLGADHIAAGGMAVTLRPDDGGPVIELRENGAVVDIMPAYDAPTALDGRAMHNIQNAMFAAAIAHGLGKSLENIRSGLNSLGVVRADTPGRLDIFDRFSFTVILDHAHNPREFDAVTKILLQMECAGRRIVAFTAPGDRPDRHIDNLAATAARSAYDHYVCFRRDELRGRGPSEVPERLRDGLLAGGVPEQNISIAPPEMDAVKAASTWRGRATWSNSYIPITTAPGTC